MPWLSNILGTLALKGQHDGDNSSAAATYPEAEQSKISHRSANTSSHSPPSSTAASAAELQTSSPHTSTSSKSSSKKVLSSATVNMTAKHANPSPQSAKHKDVPVHSSIRPRPTDSSSEAGVRTIETNVPYNVMATAEDLKAPVVASYPYFGRYRLIKKMGEGAFSQVYKAVDTSTGYLVALKVVPRHQLNESQTQNIIREAQLLQTIQHPNIIQLITFMKTPHHFGLALELMAGGELFQILVDQVCFSENVCRHVIYQVAEALRYLHEQKGVVHRDIKLENLLYASIDPALLAKYAKPGSEADYIPGVGGAGIGVVKIADFGLSKVVFDTSTRTPCGTVGYTAPEILKDQRYSKGVDMWALGCVLYTILSGFPPFFDDSPRGLTEKVAKGQFTFLSPWWDEISVESKDLICHLLEVDPRKRYTIDEFLKHPWMRGEKFGHRSNIRAVAASEIQPQIVTSHVQPEHIATQPAIDESTKKGRKEQAEFDAIARVREYENAAPMQPHVPEAVIAPAAAPDVPHINENQHNNSAPAGHVAPEESSRQRHPPPDGFTKEMMAAPLAVYQQLADTIQKPEHVGVFRGGVVAGGNVMAGGNPSQPVQAIPGVNGAATHAVPINSTAPMASAKHQKQLFREGVRQKQRITGPATGGFTLDMGSSSILAKRRQRVGVVG